MTTRQTAGRRQVRRSAVVCLLGHTLFGAVMLVAALNQDDGLPFWFLAGCGVLGAVAAALLATSVGAADEPLGRITTATVVMVLAFVSGATAAFLGGPSYLIAPVVLLFANGMLVGAARRAVTEA